jgi:hypothetical protein
MSKAIASSFGGSLSRGDDVLLVGNGPSLLEQHLGPRIDAFTHIVRFNGFELNGFETHVGTRTTIWSRWYALPTIKPMKELDRIWLNMPVHERTEDKLAKAMALVAPWAEKVDIIPTLDVAVEVQRELFGGPHPSRWPSSGLLAIVHALSLGCDVTLAGFDSWSKEPFHYYGHHDRSNTHHVAELEREYIGGLLSTGSVRRLA